MKLVRFVVTLLVSALVAYFAWTAHIALIRWATPCQCEKKSQP